MTTPRLDWPLANDRLGRYWWYLRISFAVSLALVGIALAQSDQLTSGESIGPLTLLFVPNTLEAAFETLTALLLVALFIERANEVFIKNTRTVRRTIAERRIASLEAALAQAQETERSEAQKQLEAAKDDLTRYRTATRILTIAFSTILGTLTALAGVRALTPLLDVQYEALSGWQWGVLNFVDIVLTVSLVTGGASALHNMISMIGDRIEPSDATEGETRPK